MMKALLRSHGIPLRWWAQRYRNFSVPKDITGSIIRTAAPAAIMESWDESIMNILSSNQDSRPKLTEILDNDPNLHFAKILHVFENLRYQLSADSGTSSTLVDLEALLAEGKLSQKEGIYAAAALAWHDGDYVKAGALLETAVLSNPGDILAVRLAQDAYMMCGSSSNALGCLIRHPSMSTIPHHLHGYMLGILATGYVETGRIVLAEEEGERAVVATRGQNSWALHALMNAHQLMGRTADILARLDEYEKKHEGSTGLANLLYNRGSANVIRGNYTGAFKTVESLLDILEEQEKKGPEHCVSSVWTNAVLLLWKLNLNTHDSNSSVFDPVWKVLSQYGHHTRAPMQDICASVAFASAAAAKPVVRRPRPQPAAETDPAMGASAGGEAPKGNKAAPSWWEKLTGAGSPPKPNRVQDGGASSQKDSLRLVGKHVREKYTGKLASGLEDADFKSQFSAHMERLQAGEAGTVQRERVHCPKLRSIRPDLSVVQSIRLSIVQQQSSQSSDRQVGANTISQPVSDAQFSRQECVLPLSESLWQFAQGSYLQSSEGFLQHTPQMRLLGGGAAQREVFEQMSIEALYRGDQVAMATLMLHERSVLVPNDAQCWRRLAGIYGHSGQEALAKQAHYTAWQLGIGQGGFGGPR